MGKGHRLLVVEDQAIVRETLAHLLQGVFGFDSVFVAADGLDAVRQVRAHKPDLVLIDLSLPRMNGTDALREIKKISPMAKAVVLTSHRGEEWLLEALRAGADAYVVKEASFAELLTAVRSVLGGFRYLSPQVCAPVLDAYLKVNAGTAGDESPGLERLSSRERQILKLIGEGHSTKQIGELLFLSPRTVEKGRTSLGKKLGLGTIPALTAYAIKKGLLVR